MARPELLRRDHCIWSSSLVVTASWRKGYSYANGNRRPFFAGGCKGNMAPTYSLKCIGILILHVTANGLAASFYDPAGWLNIKIRGKQKCWWNFWIMIVLPPLKNTHTSGSKLPVQKGWPWALCKCFLDYHFDRKKDLASNLFVPGSFLTSIIRAIKNHSTIL